MFPINLISRFKSFPAYANMRLVEDDFENRLTKYFESDNCWLDEREQQIVLGFFKDEKTLQKLGQEHFITRERVRQIIARSVEKLDYINNTVKWFYDDDKEIEDLINAKNYKVQELTNQLMKLEEITEGIYRFLENDNVTMGEIKGFLEDKEVDKLTIKIYDLDLTVRTHNCLHRNSIENVGQLIQYSESDLLKIRNFGKKCLVELKEKLDHLNLKLKEE